MNLVDANVLIYAADRASGHHETAHTWLENAFNGPTTIGFSWIVLLAFLRITTSARVFPNPLAVKTALEIVDSGSNDRMP